MQFIFKSPLKISIICTTLHHSKTFLSLTTPSLCLSVLLSLCLSVSLSFFLSALALWTHWVVLSCGPRWSQMVLVNLSPYKVIEGRLRSILGLIQNYMMDRWMGWMVWMVIIGHRSSKSTFGADNNGIIYQLYHQY